MSRLASIGLCCALAAGCEADDDVVARLTDRPNEAGPPDVYDAGQPGVYDAGLLDLADARAGAPECCGDSSTPSPTVTDGAVPEAVACVADGALMYLLTKQGALYRVQSEQGVIEPLGVLDCLSPGTFVAAVDLNGQLWVASEDSTVRVIDPVSRACREVRLAISASAMAFLYDASFHRPVLYAVEAGTLYAIDPTSLSRVPLRPLSTPGGQVLRSLAGTATGELFAFAEGADSGVSIGLINLGDVSVTWRWTAPPVGSLVGGVAWSGDFGLAFQSELYRLRTASEELQPVAKLVTDGSGFFSVAPSPCVVASTK